MGQLTLEKQQTLLQVAVQRLTRQILNFQRQQAIGVQLWLVESWMPLLGAIYWHMERLPVVRPFLVVMYSDSILGRLI